MLDIDTMRIAQSLVGICAFVLVYVGTYRATGAPYARWWALVVMASAGSTVLYLTDAFVAPALADALGNGTAVLSAAFAWAAARSLRHQGMRAARLVAVPLVVFAGTAILGLTGVEEADADGATGTMVLVAGMALMFVLASRQLWMLVRENAQHTEEVGAGTRAGAVAVAVAATSLGVFYLVRLVGLIVLGGDSEIYQTWLGPMATTIVVMLAIVTVTYSVTELSRYEIADRWRVRALRDDLTGLYVRSAFRERVERAARSALASGEMPVLVLADFDHFKQLNDTHGHGAGDRVLLAFGDACREVMTAEDLAARTGGEEFCLLISRTPRLHAVDAALAVTDRIGRSLERRLSEELRATVSFGIAPLLSHDTFDAALGRADLALYEAKGAGRARAVVYGATPEAAGGS